MKTYYCELLRSSLLLFVLCLAACSTVNSGSTNVAGTPTFTNTGSLMAARMSHTATLLPNGKVLVSGGRAPKSRQESLFAGLTNAELYDPTTGIWVATGSLVKGRYGHTATLLPNGKVLVSGGVSSVGYLASAELYDPGTGTWATTGSLVNARVGHAATLLPNGKVLVSGGYNPTGLGLLANAELYDPTTGTWTATGSLVTAREIHTATLLPNGKVLVSGGTGNKVIAQNVLLASAELYDPITGIWTVTGSLVTARDNHTATLLPNGKVLIIGGTGNSKTRLLERVLFNDPEDSTGPLGSCELFDPNTGTWTATGPLATARQSNTVTLLPNGTVLVSGGAKDNTLAVNTFSTGFHSLYKAFASAEVFDPTSGNWMSAGSLATPRLAHTATLTPNGNVLISGGFNEDGFPASTELYEVHP